MSQEKALEILKSGSNVFITGAAGTGKTYVLSQFIQHLKDNNIYYGITASTGIAATQFNGVTIHSWSGIGVKDKMSLQDIDNIKRNIKLNYKMAKVLIIDEISMLHAHQLDMIDAIAKRVLDNEKPFGGLQLVLCGDFCQLPPVANENNDQVVFAYESNAWKQGQLKVCYLDKQYRQSNTDPLTDILNSIRSNKVDSQVRNRLEDLSSNKPEQATKLYTTNTDVDFINNFQLRKITTKAYTFKMTSYGDHFLVAGLKKRCLAKEVLELKVGALVIFIQNDRDKRYVNGTLGTIKGFTKYGSPIVETKDNIIYANESEWKVEDIEGKELARISQLPICLAWAITVHKSQGMTLDAAEIDLSKAFCYGMGYVALSRVRDSSGLRLIGFNDKALKIDPKMLEQDRIFREESIICQ